jgi:hypothetical protein
MDASASMIKSLTTREAGAMSLTRSIPSPTHTTTVSKSPVSDAFA